MTSDDKRLRLLGRGAMGTVHLVERADGTRLALKHPRPEVAEAVLATHRRLQALAHPHVVAVVAVGADEEGPYVALEHVDGTSVGDLVREVAKVDEDVPPPIVGAILRDAASGLCALHAFDEPAGSGGWLHRDLSPSNVLLGLDGGVRLADLDTATPRNESFAHPTLPTRGKASYASPELLAGGEVDDRADVFALGATVGELLVRGPLFRSDARDEDAVVDLADKLAERDDAPPALLELLIEMLALDPRHRPSAAEVHDRAAALLPQGPGPELGSYVASFAADDRSASVAPPLRVSLPPPGAPWHIKGGAIAATVDYLIQNFGEQAYGRVVDHVSDRSIEALRDHIDATAWYDGRVVVELTEAAERLYGRGPHSLAKDIGAWSAERALSAGGPYQIFRDKGLKKGVAAFMEATDDLYGLYYDQGEWVLDHVGETGTRCRLVGVRYPEALVQRIVAYLRRGLELIGVEDVRTRCEQAEDGLRIEATWSVPR